MKKILLVGADTFMIAHIEKVLENQDVNIVVNNHEVKDNMRERYLEEDVLYKPSPEFYKPVFFDKPKSKFHK